MADDARSRIRRTTVEELRPLFEPELLTFVEPSAAEQERFARFEKILVREGPDANWGERRNAVAEMREILGEGPMSRTWVDSDACSPLYKPLKDLSKWAASENGDLAFASLLIHRNRAGTFSMMHFLINTAGESYLLRGIAREARRHADSGKLQDVRSLVATTDAPDLRLAFLADFHYGILPGLADPAAQAEGKGGSAAMLWQIGDPWREATHDDWFGNYDPISTARDVNAILRSTLKNVDSLPSTYDHSGMLLAGQRLDGIPRLPRQKGWLGDLQWRMLRQKMNSMENSIGRALCSFARLEHDLVVASWTTRTHRGLIAILIALRLHRLQTGRDAKSLDELVSAGLLPSIPYDFLGEAPIRYDSKRRIIWSVGRDRRNGGGVFAVEANALQPDFGYFVDGPDKTA